MKMERRFFSTVLRAKSDKSGPKRLIGYVAKFNELSGDLGGFREKIAPGAFAESIKNDDIRALFNHDSNFVLGRTSAGTLQLSEDRNGLLMEVVLPDTQAARDLWQSVSRGDITSQSFSFTTIKDSYETVDGEQIRTLLEVKLFDVGPVTFPAYESSDIQARQRALTNTSKGDIQMTTPELLEEKGRIVKEMRDINDKYQPGQAYSAEHEESYRRMERRLDEINQLLRRERLEREQIAASESGASVSRGAVGNMDSDFHEEVRARSQGAIRNIQPGELRGFFPPNPDGERRISLKAMQVSQRTSDSALKLGHSRLTLMLPADILSASSWQRRSSRAWKMRCSCGDWGLCCWCQTRALWELPRWKAIQKTRTGLPRFAVVRKTTTCHSASAS